MAFLATNQQDSIFNIMTIAKNHSPLVYNVFRAQLSLGWDTVCLTFFYWIAFLTFILYRSTALSFINTSVFYALALSHYPCKTSLHNLPRWIPGVAILFVFLKTYGSVFSFSLGRFGVVGASAFYAQPFILSLIFQILRYRVHYASPILSLDLFGVIKNSLFFTGLQILYGMLFFFYTPYLFEPYLAATRHNIPLHYEYPSQFGMRFFYKDRDQADRIAKQIPQILSVLRSSPFFKSPKQLTLVQSPQSDLQPSTQGSGLKEAQNGAYYADTGMSYYFTTPLTDRKPLEHNFYSRAEPDYTIPLHELTHQMVSQYYGLYYVNFFIPQWKDEGYAEYMSAIGCYNDPLELLAILECFKVPPERVSQPFPQGLQKSSTHDYIGALIQTKYALDYLQLDPREFFSPFYKPQTSEEIISWLQNPTTEKESHLV